ncbi:hypothetical protein SCHPADRAFT_971542 [Schizopora paradoxa]|uniref:Uncharacterized protein n=1 Tax=Schizopora paradoxa TaxID=27342 RepID=A0A0H2RLA6_9AGAM|nr:hypothetical protein SCHPADRAFT_971542 [Schizopora paradoxa]
MPITVPLPRLSHRKASTARPGNNPNTTAINFQEMLEGLSNVVAVAWAWVTRTDKSDRGKYTSVRVSPRQFVRKDNRLRVLVYLVVLSTSSLALMLCHHFFYRYLNKKNIDLDAAELPTFLEKQSNVKFIGTTIAHGSRLLLSMAIGVTFSQHFWKSLRSRSHSISQIDALIHSGQSAFHYSTFTTAMTSSPLFFISIVSSITALIVVLTPGSLTVSPAVERQVPCSVPSIPEVTTHLNTSFDIDNSLFAVAASALSLNSYLPPFQVNQSATCGRGTSSCSYNVSFIGPALDCVDITNQANFSFFLDPKLQGTPSAAPFLIWNGSFFSGDASTPIGLSIFSRDLLQGSLHAVNCTAYNATYDVGVRTEGASSSVQIWNVKWNSELLFVNDSSFLQNYAYLGVDALTGLIFAGPNAYAMSLTTFRLGNLQSTTFFSTTPTGNHTFSNTISHFAETFMQNLSISLLSGGIYYGVSNDTATNLRNVTTTCSASVTAYTYNSYRLLYTYSSILGIAGVVLVYGCFVISRNGAEHKLLFSDIVQIALNKEMFLTREKSKLDGRTRVHIERVSGSPDKLLPLSPISGCRNSEIPHASMSLDETRDKKSTNGKVPTTSSQISSIAALILNQTISSDIGIALSYGGQIVLVVAMSFISAQIFWRTIRSRGHTISQIDQLITIQTFSFPRSFLRTLRVSWGVPLLALLAVSTSLVSIFSSGSLKISVSHKREEACTVLAPRNLSMKTTLSDYTSPLIAVMLSGTYLQPGETCSLESYMSSCNYDLEFVGPGFDCEDVSSSTNATEFSETWIYKGTVPPQSANNLTIQIFVQSWDIKGAKYQAVNCTAVARQYSVSISSGGTSPSIVNVTQSRPVSVVHANTSQLDTFEEIYLSNMAQLIEAQGAYISDFGGGVAFASTSESPPGPAIDLPVTFPFSRGGSIGQFELDGNVSMAENLSLALEGFAQDATMSILSGTIFALNPNNPNLLENTTTMCTYSFTAYEYTPLTLFLTYGIAIGIATFCAALGSIAIKRNGVEETLDFSRFLRAVINEKLYSVKDRLDMDTKLKADDTADGNFAPSLS